MSKLNANYYTNGTCALEMPARYKDPRNARFRAFAGAESHRRETKSIERSHRTQHVKNQSRLQSVLEGSEMFCSLKTEDARGCRFDQFSYGQATFLAGASSVVAIVALLLGA